MTSQLVIKSPPSTPPLPQPHRRRQTKTLTLTPTPTPSPSTKPPSPSSSTTNVVGELAGVTTANCFIFCCCCPCIVLEFLILAVYKVPVTLGRRIWRHQRKKIKSKKRITTTKKNNNKEEVSLSGTSEVYCNNCREKSESLIDVDLNKIKVSVDGSAVDLDKKMWEQFCETGFWRSSSQRHS